MITIFIGTFNRLSTLERTVKSFERFKTPHELVIVDNGTDHPECLALLQRLKKRVKKVYSLPGCDSMEEATDNFNAAIREEYEEGDAEWFAVSEADVCFEGTSPRALDAYIELAIETGRAVGPHTRVDAGIPACYPLRSRVLATESRLLYRDSMRWHEDIPHADWQIDTTFHLFPRTRRFERLHLNPIRCGPPFDAMHLDWYLDIFNPSRESEIYLPGLRPVGSWGKAWIRDFWVDFQQDRELAFRNLLLARRSYIDLCNTSFMLSWCYQYGQGVTADHDESVRWLDAAIPADTVWVPFRDDWLRMIYENDFSCLGW